MMLLAGMDLQKWHRLREDEAAFDARMRRVMTEKNELNNEIGKLGRRVTGDSVKGMRKEVQYINDLINQKIFSWTAFLSDLEKYIPANISVTRIEPDFKSGTVVLGGMARSLRDLTQFVSNLQKGTPFQDVFLNQQESLEKEEIKKITFSIRFKYRAREEGT